MSQEEWLHRHATAKAIKHAKSHRERTMRSSQLVGCNNRQGTWMGLESPKIDRQSNDRAFLSGRRGVITNVCQFHHLYFTASRTVQEVVIVERFSCLWLTSVAFRDAAGKAKTRSSIVLFHRRHINRDRALLFCNKQTTAISQMMSMTSKNPPYAYSYDRALQNNPHKTSLTRINFQYRRLTRILKGIWGFYFSLSHPSATLRCQVPQSFRLHVVRSPPQLVRCSAARCNVACFLSNPSHITPTGF